MNSSELEPSESIWVALESSSPFESVLVGNKISFFVCL